MLYAVAAIEIHLRIVFAWLPFIEYIKPIRQMICWKRCECSVCVETSSTRTRRVRWMRCGGMPQNALKCTLLSYSATCFFYSNELFCAFQDGNISVPFTRISYFILMNSFFVLQTHLELLLHRFRLYIFNAFEQLIYDDDINQRFFWFHLPSEYLHLLWRRARNNEKEQGRKKNSNNATIQIQMIFKQWTFKFRRRLTNSTHSNGWDIEVWCRCG